MNFWILGLNARNLLYIKKFNPRKSIRLADNKLKTKQFLSARGIPVAQTYWVISSREQVYNFDFSALPSKTFVVKPNKWSKWEWILVVGDVWVSEEPKKQLFQKDNIATRFINDLLSKSTFPHTYKISGDYWSDDIFRRHLIDIVDGKYSLTHGSDKILIEEKLVPWTNFMRYCKHGLADIRVIVFNLVPVAAMVRVPTQGSWGKANLAQWWVGVWIEVWSGKTKTFYYKWKLFTSNFPWEFAELQNKKIPYWNDILLYSSKIQYFVNMWYLALDWVITPQWPQLLEINARAWLEVQNASNLPLEKRLQKVADLHVVDPERGVEIAKTLFNTSKTSMTSAKIIYLSQKAHLILEGLWLDQDIAKEIVVRVDTTKDGNYMGSWLTSFLQEQAWKDYILDLYESEIRIKNFSYKVSEKIPKNEIVLWRYSITDFFIKPIQKIYPIVDIINPSKILESEKEKLHILDDKLHKIYSKYNLIWILTPINYTDELDNFITWNWNYNPKFAYKFPTVLQLDDHLRQIYELKATYFPKEFGLKSPIAKIFFDKLLETIDRINLIRAYINQDYDAIFNSNISLFWHINEDLLDLSKRKIYMEEQQSKEDILGPALTHYEVKKRVQDYLLSKWLDWVKIISDPDAIARMSIVKDKNISIKILTSATIREKDLNSLLAHEVDVHLQRHMAGKRSGYHIFQSGTAWYIKDEEWLAVYKSLLQLPAWYEKKWMYRNYFLTHQAMFTDFSRLCDIIAGIEESTPISAFKVALRFKKWIVDTQVIDKWTVYMKDKVYLEWFKKISDYYESWWKDDKLMLWKITLEDLQYIA